MLTTPRILIAEDEPAIADTLHYALSSEGFAPQCCATATETLHAFGLQPPALVILDVGLPDMNGFALFRRLRALPQGEHTPMLFLTARSEEIDRVLGLEMGADDYIAKPFSPRELVARVRGILRRSQHTGRATPATETIASTTPLPASPVAPTPHSAHPQFEIDDERRRARFMGQVLALSRYEYGLLRTLVQRPGRVFSRDELLQQVWDEPSAPFDRTVDAHIKTLRAKLFAVAPTLEPIRTLRGVGYALNDDKNITTDSAA